jgi:hypothetical protein
MNDQISQTTTAPNLVRCGSCEGFAVYLTFFREEVAVT